LPFATVSTTGESDGQRSRSLHVCGRQFPHRGFVQ
jgi:hypothetical protein